MSEFLASKLPSWAEVKSWFLTQGSDLVIKLFVALAIFFVGKWLASWLTRIIVRLLERYHPDPTLSRFLGRVIQGILLVVVIIVALETVGFKTTSLLAILGGAVLAVGLALKDSLSNFASGVMIIVFRPFSVGNFVEVAGGVRGTVEEISTFHTKLRTPDNLTAIIPNSQIGVGRITNFSMKEHRRIDLVFGVSYNDDLKLAKDTIWKVLNNEERVLKTPGAVVGVDSLGDSSVNIACQAWVKTPLYTEMRFYLNETIKTELEAAGCSIPYPQRDVHLFQESIKASEEAK